MSQYSDVFCKVYNEFGWNYYPEAFGQQLLQWIEENRVTVRTSLDLGCGTGILCQILHESGIAAAGMDFSQGMIDIARKSNPEIPYDVADMILYRPDKQFDLVTCTGDALNHIMELRDVQTIFENVMQYLAPGGHFIFDILNENEVSTEEPFDLDFSETIQARFQMRRLENGVINLNTKVYENSALAFEENIYETLHDPEVICRILRETGFIVKKCSDQLLDHTDRHSTTWYIIARKPE